MAQPIEQRTVSRPLVSFHFSSPYATYSTTFSATVPAASLSSEALSSRRYTGKVALGYRIAISVLGPSLCAILACPIVDFLSYLGSNCPQTAEHEQSRN